MRKKHLILSIGFVGVAVAGLVIALWTGLDTKRPAAADVSVPEVLAEPSGNHIVSQQHEQDTGDDPLTPEELRFGGDPLSPAEQARARALVMSDPTVVQHTHNVRHAVLQVQRHREPKHSPLETRRADILIYVYPGDLLLHGIANLSTDIVDNIVVTQEWQPVLITRDETLHALGIALADDEVGPLIRERYEQLRGTPLVGLDQLRVTAGVYRGSKTSVCGSHRCAQLLLGLNLIPIVDLSTEQVVYVDQ